MEQKYALLLELVRSQINGQQATIPENPDLSGLFDAARRHKLQTFVYAALEGTAYEPQAMAAIGADYHGAVFKDAQADYVRGEITRVLEKAGVDHVYQRGICLKHDYPVPAMRTMSDMDILVRSRDLHKLPKIMKELTCEQQPGDGNHRTFLVEPGVTVEFHPELIHCSSHVGTGINPGWQYVPEGQSRAEKEMTEEGFYLNILCHLANHFATGGVGVRFVLDVWVCNHLRQTKPDRAYVEQELQRVGLLQFAKQIEQLAEVWFSGAPGDELMEELGAYILTSSSHGQSQRAMLNAVCLSPGGSGFSALWRKVFYPKQDLYNRYDWVKGRAWLLPVAWLVRVFQAITRHGSLIKNWGKGTMKFSDEQVEQQRQKLARFGIREA